MDRKMLRNVEKRGVQAARKRSERGREVLTAHRVRYPFPEKLGVRHEAADVAVMTGRKPGHNPVCDHWYPTKTCGRSNPMVRSSWDNETSPDPDGRVSRERTRRLLAPRRSGARVDGMANSGELLINAVNSSKPKALTGLNQKVNGQVQGFSFPLPSLSSHRRIGRA